jgi:hypothetical protein
VRSEHEPDGRGGGADGDCHGSSLTHIDRHADSGADRYSDCDGKPDLHTHGSLDAYSDPEFYADSHSDTVTDSNAH